LRREMARAAGARAAGFTPQLQAEAYLSAYESVRTFCGRETAFSVAWRT
jgi:hypothetical protein